MLDAGDGFFSSGAEQARNGCEAGDSALVGHVHPGHEDAAAVGDLVVPVQFVFYPKEDEGGAGDTEGQAGNVEDAMSRAFAPAADGGGEMVP